ncbi:VOC family protein [Nocardioides zhouii]|uniref:VOC family protein n=1 Tax=Nocardioides zhouii TaxID=1168729 RepID=A0A4Q2SMG5_9ACTN|nr:VOC family protein [Nocardioides zhouii]RYC05249.1 VOC family protein [Nocardioides zhouii]
MTPLPWIQVFLDSPVVTFEEAVAFWSAATGWRVSERRGEDGQFLTLLPAAGSAYVKMQAVDGPAGLHLDLDSVDRPATIEQARELGATTAWTYHDVEVMRSPGGFTFCQTLLADHLDDRPVLVRDGSTILDQVCLDIPSSSWDTEVAFWRDLTGRELQEATAPGFARLVAPDQPRILLQRLDDPDGPGRAHPDLATADRAADTDRHVRLGATVRAVHAYWSVLMAPGGQVYCLTDRDPRTGTVTRTV